MSEVFERITQARLGGKVERCHGIPHLGSYSNAAHTWGVLLLLYYLFPGDFMRLAAVALAHDVPEGWVGDVPATVMRYSKSVRPELAKLEKLIADDLGLPFEGDLSPEDHAKLKACDRLDLYLWCMDQLAYGNLHAAEPMRELDRYFTESPLPSPALEFWDHIRGDLQKVIPKQAGVVQQLVEKVYGDDTLD